MPLRARLGDGVKEVRYNELCPVSASPHHTLTSHSRAVPHTASRAHADTHGTIPRVHAYTSPLPDVTSHSCNMTCRAPSSHAHSSGITRNAMTSYTAVSSHARTQVAGVCMNGRALESKCNVRVCACVKSQLHVCMHT